MPERTKAAVVIDDTEANRYVVMRILEDAGFEVTEGGSGADAIRLAQTDPDLIVLDVHLPDLNGFEVCRRIKADPHTSSIPVLHISASFTTPEARAQGLDSGADAYLTHPIEPVVLTATVRALLRVKEAEDALRANMEKLSIANQSLAEKTAEAEAANRAKMEFLTTMSHELRTPLNAIAGYVDLMSMKIHGPLTGTQADALDRIRHNQRHLLGLINDVLNFAKIEAGQMTIHISEIDMAQAVAEVEALIDPVGEKGIKYSSVISEPAPIALGDLDKVEQILINLLSNAVKFTAAGGAITVTTEAKDSSVHVHVKDTGAGVPNEKLESIFEPFVQVAPHLTRKNQGTGLGLAISRDLAHRMGGSIEVASREGEGSTFTLTLPRAPLPA